MKNARFVVSALVLSCLVLGAGCGAREETPTTGDNETTVYRAADAPGVSATITFCEKIGSKTGRPIHEGRVFTTGEDEKVRALVEITHADALGQRDLMFHLVWTGPDDEAFYTKRTDVVPEGSEARIESAISIPPDRREPGIYTLRVYLFRELIAEKTFELRAPGGK